MKNIVIINESSNAANYGIGTYIEQFENIAKYSSSIKVLFVYIDKGTEGEISIDAKQIKIYRSTLYSLDRDDNFYLGVARLLTRYIQDRSIFHFNFHSHLRLIKEIRERFPQSKLLYAVHYQKWSFLTKGISKIVDETISRLQHTDRTVEEKLICDTYFEDLDVFRIVDHIVCLCEYTSSILKQTFLIDETKISVIPNGVNEKKLLPNDAQNAFSYSVSPPSLLYVGRLHEDKGLYVLARALKHILPKYPDLKLWIVGDGDFSGILKHIAPHWSNVVFTGRLSRKELSQLYRQATIGILPSYSEQCSYTAIEMMVFNLPIIATDAMGLSEMISPYRNGIAVPLRRVDNLGSISDKDIAVAVLEILKDRSKFTQGRAIYLSKYTENKMLNSYISLYNTLLS